MSRPSPAVTVTFVLDFQQASFVPPFFFCFRSTLLDLERGLFWTSRTCWTLANIILRCRCRCTPCKSHGGSRRRLAIVPLCICLCRPSRHIYRTPPCVSPCDGGHNRHIIFVCFRSCLFDFQQTSSNLSSILSYVSPDRCH